MNYLDKCAVKTDLLFNKLKPNRNIIVFIVSESCYVAYTLLDMKAIMASSKNHYINDSNKLEPFFYLPNGIVIDSSLSICFENKVNTMKLVRSEPNKFYTGFGPNKQTFVYYNVEPVFRKEINSQEDWTFKEELKTDKPDNDSMLKSTQLN